MNPFSDITNNIQTDAKATRSYLTVAGNPAAQRMIASAYSFFMNEKLTTDSPLEVVFHTL
jgi:hypothetical protein